jgi:hypothetical protein
MSKKKIQYWAVGLNFDYDIVSKEPDESNYGSIEGPFTSLSQAKAQIREWIRFDRMHLTTTLRKVMSIRRKRNLASLALILLLASGCGRTAHSDSTRADVIPSPRAGYTCFAIYDSEGKMVGGNCVKE